MRDDLIKARDAALARYDAVAGRHKTSLDDAFRLAVRQVIDEFKRIIAATDSETSRGIFEEKRDRDLQDLRNLLQPASADAVRALLVFLYLLEGQAERPAKFFLAHCKHFPAHAHSAADVLVNGVWSLLGDGGLFGWRPRSLQALRSDHGNHSACRKRPVDRPHQSAQIPVCASTS
jgi:hypothetical protein